MAHLVYHLLSSAPHGIHGHTTKEEYCHYTKEDPHNHLGVHKVDLEVMDKVNECRFNGGYTIDQLVGHIQELDIHDSHFFKIRSQQCKSSESGTTDGKTFARGSGGITESIEGIGAFAHFRSQLGHFGIASGIIGYGAIGIGCQGDSQGGKHPYCCQTNAVQAKIQIVNMKVKTGGKRIGECYPNHDNR